ncbi:MULTISPECIES: Ig-like domain-containing protein, partial [unclassified Leucobacter]
MKNKIGRISAFGIIGTLALSGGIAHAESTAFASPKAENQGDRIRTTLAYANPSPRPDDWWIGAWDVSYFTVGKETRYVLVPSTAPTSAGRIRNIEFEIPAPGTTGPIDIIKKSDGTFTCIADQTPPYSAGSLQNLYTTVGFGQQRPGNCAHFALTQNEAGEIGLKVVGGKADGRYLGSIGGEHEPLFIGSHVGMPHAFQPLLIPGLEGLVTKVAFEDAVVSSMNSALSGTGQPGAQVEVKDKDGTSLGTTTVAEDGTWSLTPTSDLAKGPNQLTAVQTPKDGGETSEATATITVNVVDQLAVSGPTAGSTVTTDKPVVTGTSEPKADITITDKDGKVIGTTTANAKGEWSITLPAQPNGLVEITVTDEHGQKVDHSFTVDVAAPIAELVITGPKEGATVDTDTPNVTGTAQPGAKVTVTGKDGETL